MKRRINLVFAGSMLAVTGLASGLFQQLRSAKETYGRNAAEGTAQIFDVYDAAVDAGNNSIADSARTFIRQKGLSRPVKAAPMQQQEQQPVHPEAQQQAQETAQQQAQQAAENLAAQPQPEPVQPEPVVVTPAPQPQPVVLSPAQQKAGALITGVRKGTKQLPKKVTPTSVKGVKQGVVAKKGTAGTGVTPATQDVSRFTTSVQAELAKLPAFKAITARADRTAQSKLGADVAKLWLNANAGASAAAKAAAAKKIALAVAAAPKGSAAAAVYASLSGGAPVLPVGPVVADASTSPIFALAINDAGSAKAAWNAKQGPLFNEGARLMGLADTAANINVAGVYAAKAKGAMAALGTGVIKGQIKSQLNGVETKYGLPVTA